MDPENTGGSVVTCLWYHTRTLSPHPTGTRLLALTDRFSRLRWRVEWRLPKQICCFYSRKHWFWMVNHIFFETLKVHPWSVKCCEEGKIEQKVYETHKLQYQHLILDAFQALARGSMTPRPAPDCKAGRVSMREFLPILPRGMSTLEWNNHWAAGFFFTPTQLKPWGSCFAWVVSSSNAITQYTTS